MPFNDTPLPRNRRGLDERRSSALASMRRAGWMAYIVGALNLLAGLVFAEEAARVAWSLLPTALGGLVVICGFGLAQFQSRAAGVALLVATVGIFVARWGTTGKVGAVLPGIVALYLFWQGLEAAIEWHRLRDYELPVDASIDRAV
jgi:hypothetical protein